MSLYKFIRMDTQTSNKELAQIRPFSSKRIFYKTYLFCICTLYRDMINPNDSRIIKMLKFCKVILTHRIKQQE